MGVVKGAISLTDNATAVLRGIRKEQSAFRKDVETTKSALKSTWGQKYQARLDATAASKTLSQLKSKMDPLRKKVVTAVAVKEMATAKLKTVGEKMKAVGKMVAQPMVALKDKASAGLTSLKNMAGSLAKGFTIAVGIAGAGASAIVGGALSEGANLQQNIGGVETLFKDDAGVVKANADKAFKTAGLSANAYMETVTGFSASLLQSLNGDTAKAAQMSDMAIVDMADNANKMGTSMDSIQNAYSGFAKQNYTMLDNLKLGYGGTKEEMQRLLDDATKMSGVKYDMGNLSDVYSAIHVVQENLGITGTTAKEASETFSGSFASMKASVSNLLGALATGGDVEAAMGQVIDTAATFLIDNAVPMIGNVLTALPGAIRSGIQKAAPKVKKMAGPLLSGLKDGLVSAFPSLGPVIESGLSVVTSALPGFISGISGLIPQFMAFGSAVAASLGQTAAACLPVVSSIVSAVQQTLPAILPVIQTVITTISGLIAQAAPIISGLVSGISAAIQTLAPVFQTIFSGIGEKVSTVIGIVSEKMGFIQQVISAAAPAVSAVLSAAWSVVSPIMDIAISVFELIFSVVERVFPGIQSIIQSVWSVVQPIVEGIGGALQKVAGWIGGAAKAISGGGSGGSVGSNAEGTNNWKGGLTWVGEKGPELVDLPRGSRVLPNKESVSITRKTAGGSALGTSVARSGQESSAAAYLANIDNNVRLLVERIRGTSGGMKPPGQDGSDRKPRGFLGSVSVQIAKLADEIQVRSDGDIDDIADRVAKKVIEVVVNMG